MEFSETIDWNKLDNDAHESDWHLTEELFEKFSLKPTLCERVVTLGGNGELTEPPNEDVSPPIPEPRIPFPRISAISTEDQKYFLETYKEYVSGKEFDMEGINRLENLIWTLMSEQKEFSMFLQQHSLSLKNEYNFVQPQIKESVQKLLADHRARAVHCLAPCYTLFQTVGLSAGAVFPNDPILCYIRTLKQAVEQPLLYLPNVEENTRLLLKNGEDEDVFAQVELCQDSTACEFSTEYGVHFVLTAEAFQTLIDNHQPDYDKAWELPVSVVDHSNDVTESTSSCSKTIVIDSPLPPKTITPREMNVMYYQREICRLLRNTPNKSDEASTPPRDFTQKGNNDSEKMNLDKDLMTGEQKTTDRNLQTISESLSDELSTKNLGEDVNLTITPCAESTATSSNADLLGNSLNNNDKKSENIAKNMRFSYSIWTFGNLKLLVRVANCGVLYQRNKEGKGSLHPVNVYAKPEYQLMFGYELITSSEASRWWVDSYLNPDSLCVCARIDPVSSELLRADVLSQAEIINMSSFNAAQPMKMVHNILTRLEKLLEPGRYILSHSSGDMHMCIYELVNGREGADEGKKASYDLHASHSRNDECLVYYEKFIPWVSLDPNIFHGWHIAHERIPMTFPAVSSAELAKAPGGKKKKKKKKKGNKKKATAKKTCQEITHYQEKGSENLAVNAKGGVYRKRLRSGDQFTNDNAGDGFNSEDTSCSTTLEAGIAQRLRSRTKPVSYDDLEFNF